jgi:hypothetical protein
MRSKRKADQVDYEEYIRKNRRTVDPFGGMTDPVEITKVRHEPRFLIGVAASSRKANAIERAGISACSDVSHFARGSEQRCSI